MRAKTRFIKSVVTTSKTVEVQMPWARGKHRAAMISGRKAPVKQARIA